MFVGLSNYIQVAIQKFYLKTVRRFRFLKIVSFNKGIETLLIAVVHYIFCKYIKPHIRLQKPFVYSISTKN